MDCCGNQKSPYQFSPSPVGGAGGGAVSSSSASGSSFLSGLFCLKCFSFWFVVLVIALFIYASRRGK